MVYLTKEQLIDRINVWMKYDAYTWKIHELLNIADTPDAILDFEWFARNDLLTSIILHEMNLDNLNHISAMADEIESFEFCEVFDDLVHEAQKENYSAEWVYDNLIEQWYQALQEAADCIDVQEDENLSE